MRHPTPGGALRKSPKTAPSIHAPNRYARYTSRDGRGRLDRPRASPGLFEPHTPPLLEQLPVDVLHGERELPIVEAEQLPLLIEDKSGVFPNWGTKGLRSFNYCLR